MHASSKTPILCATFIISALSASAGAAVGARIQSQKDGQTSVGPAVLWRNPADIASRDLYHGSGGKAHQPRPPFTFEKEDLGGTAPKFHVIDRNGVRWGVKMGPEARPEVAASRFVWAAGYFVNENYFMKEMQVRNMPRLRRGQSRVSEGGIVRDVRLEERPEHKLGNWSWKNNPFAGTRELNGLRVLMALINNWDLKKENNSIYQVRGGPEQRYVISDLGASFGPRSLTWKKKGDAEKYIDSKFIDSVSAGSVDFKVPGMPPKSFYVAPPIVMIRARMRWIGKDIPVEHARWIGQLLSRLPARQIRDAFRAAGYSADEVQALSRVIEGRIEELKSLMIHAQTR